MLYDFYGELLTDRQKEFFDLYYNEDLSLSEIAENAEISRQGVRDVIVRAEAVMVAQYVPGDDIGFAAGQARHNGLEIALHDAGLSVSCHRALIQTVRGLSLHHHKLWGIIGEQIGEITHHRAGQAADAGLHKHMICASLASMDSANALYILSGEDDSAIVLDQSAEVPDLSGRLVYLSTNTSGFDVTLASGQSVTVYYNDAATSVTAKGETISQLLDRLNIVPGPLDMIGVDFSGSGTILTVSSELTFYQQVTEDVPYTSTRVANPAMAKGTETVKQAGVTGTQDALYEIVYSGGEQVSRQLVEAKNCTTVNEIVEYGTAVSSVSSADRIAKVTKNDDGTGCLTFKSGATMVFSAAKSMYRLRMQKLLDTAPQAFQQQHYAAALNTAARTARTSPSKHQT